ncbi:hypothetical protein VR7878_00371 [Vibrio ruber DSM 16370]|uniref:Uncharacterized protein n=1 Tax=Vibrio ruber (strain DSM 16370 / JCM 11486 / BCRC 17186 / CECT 7878 / LMG 23124 / VR1) TaxID=1123498 RepID=A0A1R4LAF5_VIBR1|nr:hypothetical protein [Vibrio ruber]SJN53535.1 hypothetical protein VR7878_00371 [Vibrio ruber DSM 16370]
MLQGNANSQASNIILLLFQPWAPEFDAQLVSPVSEASVLSAPVHLSEMKDEPENLFCLAASHAFQNQLLRASCPEKLNHSSMNGFL